MSDLPPWDTVSSRILGDYYIFKLRHDVRISPRSGRHLNFYILETTDWINVIPITPAGDMVMIRQFRHGTGEFTLEVPGGMVDPDEDPLESARRELLEETGYIAEQIVPLGSVSPNPAFLNNRCHTYLAMNATPAGPQALGEGEDIRVELVPAVTVPDLIASGHITHALVIAGFYYYHLHHRKGQL